MATDAEHLHRMSCARVGYGVIAAIHQRKFGELGIGTTAIVEINPVSAQRAARDGHAVYDSCAKAAVVRPAFWDVCVDSSAHLAVLRDIIAIDPAANILLEKPICQHREVGALRSALAGFRGKLTVNENYSSSAVTSTVRSIAFDTLGLRARRVVVEMSKNRVSDFEAGRFVDYEAGALRYEGPHMLAILDDLGPGWAPETIDRVECDDALIELESGIVPLFGQGTADVECTSRCGVPVGLFTSMTGAVKYPYPPYGIDDVPTEQDDVRYRIVAVDGEDARGRPCSVVGFFEPVAGFPRGEGAVAVIRDGAVCERVEPLPDDTMRTHLDRAARYFGCDGENPCSAEDGLRAVEWLHAMFQTRLRGVQAAIDARRQSSGISVAELVSVDDGLLGHILQWLIRHPRLVVSAEDLAAQIGQDRAFVEPLLGRLEAKGLVARTGAGEPAEYRLRLASGRRRELPGAIWRAISDAPEP